jgi:hypothetical protein
MPTYFQTQEALKGLDNFDNKNTLSIFFEFTNVNIHIILFFDSSMFFPQVQKH